MGNHMKDFPSRVWLRIRTVVFLRISLFFPELRWTLLTLLSIICRQVNGQRLVYKFVDLPYDYKPIKKYPSNNPSETGGQKTHYANNEVSVVKPVPLPSHFIASTASPEFKVLQEPIGSQCVNHVISGPGPCCCLGRVVVAKPVSISVITQVGRPVCDSPQRQACDGTKS